VLMHGRPVNWCINLDNEGFEYPNSLPGPWWDIQFFWGHSQFSTSLYHRIMGTCSTNELKGMLPVTMWSPACKELIYKDMAREVGFYYAYNLFSACPDLVSSKRRHRRLSHRRLTRRPQTSQGEVNAFASYGDGDSGLGAPCLGNSMEIYFGLNKTLEALGIPLDNNFIVLDNGVGMNYTINAPFVGPVYERAVKKGLRVLIYEGDSDASGLATNPMEDVWVPFFGSGDGVWTPAGRLSDSDPAGRPLHLPLTQPWRPFGLEPAGRKVQGGYVMEWNHGQVQFVSIRGAGHLMPTFRPAASATMMGAFQHGKKLPAGFGPPG